MRSGGTRSARRRAATSLLEPTRTNSNLLEPTRTNLNYLKLLDLPFCERTVSTRACNLQARLGGSPRGSQPGSQDGTGRGQFAGMRTHTVRVPQQHNHHDCGLYMLQVWPCTYCNLLHLLYLLHLPHLPKRPRGAVHREVRAPRRSRPRRHRAAQVAQRDPRLQGRQACTPPTPLLLCAHSAPRGRAAVSRLSTTTNEK